MLKNIYKNNFNKNLTLQKIFSVKKHNYFLNEM